MPAYPPLSVDAAKLRRSLHLCGSILRRRDVIPPMLELTNIAGRAALRARDLEMEITSTVADGAVAQPLPLPPVMLRQILSPADIKGDIVFTRQAGETLDVEADGIQARVVVTPSEIPAVATLEDTGFMARIERTAFAKALALTWDSISQEATRYYLNGVCILPHPTDPSALTFVSTDGHRMVKHIVRGCTLANEGLREVILPREAVAALRTLLAAGTGNITIRYNPDKLRMVFSADDFTVTTKLIDGTFPDFERVIPHDKPCAFTIGTDALRRFCSRIRGVRFAPAIAFESVKGQSHEL